MTRPPARGSSIEGRNLEVLRQANELGITTVVRAAPGQRAGACPGLGGFDGRLEPVGAGTDGRDRTRVDEPIGERT